jgi:hypothetical protein
LVASDTREIVQKLVEGIACCEIVVKSLDGHTSPDEDRSSTEDLRVTVNDTWLSHSPAPVDCDVSVYTKDSSLARDQREVAAIKYEDIGGGWRRTRGEAALLDTHRHAIAQRRPLFTYLFA